MSPAAAAADNDDDVFISITAYQSATDTIAAGSASNTANSTKFTPATTADFVGNTSSRVASSVPGEQKQGDTNARRFCQEYRQQHSRRCHCRRCRRCRQAPLTHGAVGVGRIEQEGEKVFRCDCVSGAKRARVHEDFM